MLLNNKIGCNDYVLDYYYFPNPSSFVSRSVGATSIGGREISFFILSPLLPFNHVLHSASLSCPQMVFSFAQKLLFSCVAMQPLASYPYPFCAVSRFRSTNSKINTLVLQCAYFLFFLTVLNIYQVSSWVSYLFLFEPWGEKNVFALN